MRFGIGFRYYLMYFLIIGGLAWLIVLKAFEGVDESATQAAEEVLIDSANILAELVSTQVKDDVVEVQQVATLVNQYLERRMDAHIYSHHKTTPDLHIYITDKQGIVLYDSTGRSTGEDFSRWRDVWYTLKGEYGARSSAFDPAVIEPLPDERALYIAAPIYNQTRDVVGVLTVFKPVITLGDYINLQMDRIRQYAFGVFIFALVFGAAMTWLLTRSVGKLVTYANRLAKGEKAVPPRMQQTELQKLSDSITHMRDELDGKTYVEDYIHTLTHELKTPITGIQGAAELLQSPLPEDKKQHFATHILNASERMTLLIERVLQLASLEKQTDLKQVETIDLPALVDRVLQSRSIKRQSKNVSIETDLKNKAVIRGDKLLVEQALGNVLDNAIDFSPVDSTIRVILREQDKKVVLSVVDEGDGFPDYALKRVFERFYSTARADTAKQSTGLGLSFVKEIMTLHDGEVVIGNNSDSDNSNDKKGGAIVKLLFNRAKA